MEPRYFLRKLWSLLSLEAIHRAAYEGFELSFFMRQLGLFSRAGVDLPVAIRSCARSFRSSRLKQAALDVADSLERGSSLSDALALHPALFNDTTLAVVRAGEQRGQLRELLAVRSDWLALTPKTRLRPFFVYAGTIFAMMTLVLCFLMVKVIPTFEDVFSSFGRELPPLTQLVVGISRFLQNYWYLLFAMGLGAIFAIRMLLRRKSPRIERAVLTLPGFGPLLEASRLGQCLTVLKKLLDAGVPLAECLRKVAPISGPWYQPGFDTAAARIEQGQDPREALGSQARFPELMRWYVNSESKLDLSEALGEVGDMYERRYKVYLDAVPAMIEPLMIVTMGLIIGLVVISMFAPMFGLGDMV